jgi:hypothetical protein
MGVSPVKQLESEVKVAGVGSDFRLNLWRLNEIANS